jgi:hypothetical protein
MLQKRARFDLEAANDNRKNPVRTTSAGSKLIRLPGSRSEPFRLGPRSLLVAAGAGLVLFALCGTFLLGLAAVGVLASIIAVFRFIGHLRGKRFASAVKGQAAR